LHDEYGRFEGFGVPPAKNGDYAFLLHMIKSLKSTGKAAVILPHGVLFRGHAEAEIRKNIIERGYIKGIIGLPANLFFGTGIPACIIVLDKENAENRKGIFLIDASKGFYKDGNKNRLRARDIHKIVDVFTKKLEIAKYSRMVAHREIEKNEFNLNIPRYIDSQDEEDLQDIAAHLLGDIPNKDVDDLERYWHVYPSLKKVLFSTSKRKEYSVLKIEQSQIKSTIFSHPEFVSASQKIEKIFKNWEAKNLLVLKHIKIGSKPKELITDLSEDLLVAFSKIELIEKYDVYQQLMTYWSETMQDDVYLIAVNGWKVEINVVKNKKGKETGWDCDLIPKSIAIHKYFAKEQEAIEKIRSELENVDQQMQTLDEENSGEDDLFAEAKNEAGKINKGNLSKRIKEIRGDKDLVEELKVLQEYIALTEKESELNGKLNEAEGLLDKKLLVKYKT